MKRSSKFAGILALLFGVGGFGFSKYMSADDQGRTTEVATQAIVDVANAAARWAADRSDYTVAVVNRVGQGRVGDEREAPMAVRAELAVRGGSGLSSLCASLPRVRDAMNAVLADRMVKALRAAINRVVEGGPIARVRLSIRRASGAMESGCTDGAKTANNAPPPGRP